MVNYAQNKNSNYHRIEKLILGAFMYLSSQKHYSQISVTELCKAAGVNRTTFYKHYRGTWEIKERISQLINFKVDELHQAFLHKNFLDQSEQLFLSVNKEIDENMDFFRAVFNMKGSHTFTDSIIKEIKAMAKEALTDDSPLVQVAFSYFMGGILNTYHDWFSGDLKCTLDELAYSLAKFIECAKSIQFER